MGKESEGTACSHRAGGNIWCIGSAESTSFGLHGRFQLRTVHTADFSEGSTVQSDTEWPDTLTHEVQLIEVGTGHEPAIKVTGTWTKSAGTLGKEAGTATKGVAWMVAPEYIPQLPDEATGGQYRYIRTSVQKSGAERVAPAQINQYELDPACRIDATRGIRLSNRSHVKWMGGYIHAYGDTPGSQFSQECLCGREVHGKQRR